jgi:hypothetical protein
MLKSADQQASETADAQNSALVSSVAPQIAKGAMDVAKNPQAVQAISEAQNG